MKNDWEYLQALLELESFMRQRRNLSADVFAVLLRNYWIDSCCLIIYLLVSWGGRSSGGELLSLRVAKALFDGEVLKAGGDSGRQIKPLSSLSDLLSSWLRQYFAEGGYGKGYRSRLDELMRDLQGVRDREWVSGRIYSGWGGHDLDSVVDSQIVLFCCMAKSAWTPPQGLTNDLRRLASGNDDVARDMIIHLKSIETRLAEIRFSEWGASFSYLRGNIENEESLETAKLHVKSAFQTLVQFLQGLHDERLREANVSPTRLLEIAKSSSSRAFVKESSEVPVSLFQVVDSSGEIFEERRLTVANFEKGQLTDPPMAPLPANEEEWFAETTKDHVALFVMTDLLACSQITSVDASTPEKY
ncbi:MAG: hypothetical protein MN733_27600, partial [Nitrososphaera sp.]|nr:hypothetical protein [Nitrososphaera sp.]